MYKTKEVIVGDHKIKIKTIRSMQIKNLCIISRQSKFSWTKLQPYPIDSSQKSSPCSRDKLDLYKKIKELRIKKAKGIATVTEILHITISDVQIHLLWKTIVSIIAGVKAMICPPKKLRFNIPNKIHRFQSLIFSAFKKIKIIE